MIRKIFCLLFTVTLLAAQTSAQDINGPYSASSVVYSHIPSSYCISIPTNIRADGTVYDITSQSIDLCSGDRVVVKINGIGQDGYTSLTTEDGKVMRVGFYNNYGLLSDGSAVGVFEDNSTIVGGQFYANWVDHLGAGDYYGNVTFSISLEEVVNIGY